MTETELHLQCAQTLSRFYHYLDTSDYAGLRDILAEETVWHRKGEALRGPEAILEALRQRDPARQTSHQISNLYVTLGPDNASAISRYYVNVYDNQGAGGQLQLKVIMSSEDSFLLRDGQWILADKRARKLL